MQSYNRREWLKGTASAAMLRDFGAATHAQQTTSASSGWRAGVAKTVITPRESIWLAGYGARTRPSEGVLQDLYVKCLALQFAGQNVSAIVTSDLLGFPRDVADDIARECRSRHGLPRERLILNSSHTHSGPVVGKMLKSAYPGFNSQQEEVVARYTRELTGSVLTAIARAMQSMTPATLSFGQGLAGFGVNRRRVRLRNLPGPVDHDVPVLSVRDSAGGMRAILFGYACHNTSLGNYQINGDWAGFAQEELEKSYPGATALFVEGCGADINPLPRYQGNDPALMPYSLELPRMYGKTLAAAVNIALHEQMQPLTGPLNAAYRLVDVPFHNAPTREELRRRLEEKGDGNASRRRHAQLMLSILERDGKLPERYPYAVQAWQFGRGMKLIALAGEVVVDYSLRLKAQHGWNDTWVAGYSNDVFAYIPSRRVLNEGGYEGADAMIGYGQPGPFGAAVEEIIVETVNDVLQKVRNP